MAIILKEHPLELSVIILMYEWHDNCDLFQNTLGGGSTGEQDQHR